MDKINPPEAFDFVPASWPSWRTRFLRYLSISGQGKRTEAEKIDILIYIIGKQGETLAKQLKFTEKEKFEEVLQSLDAYFIPKKNVIYERFKFNSRIQKEAEEVDEYVRQLYILAETCEFGIMKEEFIRDRIVVGLRDTITSERMQLKPELTLEDAIRMAKQAEEQERAKIMMRREESEIKEREAHEINKVQQNKRQDRDMSKVQQNKKCWWCGRMGVRKKDNCPAKAASCFKCKKTGHFSICCRDWRQINRLDAREDFEVKVDVYIEKNKQSVKFLIDTGADIVALPFSMVGRKVRFINNKETIRGPDGAVLQVIGCLYVKLVYKGTVFQGKAFVIENLQTPILGRPAIKQMNILKFCNNIQIESGTNCLEENIKGNQKVSGLDKMQVEKEFPGIFNELGVFKDKFNIKLIDNPKPFVQYTPRVVPIPLLTKVKQELDRLVKLEVLTPVEEPTMFVSPIVVVPKGEKGVRICGDYTQVNKNILRPIYPIPKVENTLGRLKGAKVFSKIDATAGFYQICLEEDSRKITTILTPFGRYMYNRLPMGLNCAPEYFSMKYTQLFSDLEGVVIHVDDILVYAKDMHSHDKLLREVLRRLSKEGLTINKEKCVFGVEKIAYLGHIISSQGIALDPDRVESIKSFPQPRNKKELMQFLGLVNYVGRFVPDKTNILEPLNELLKDGVSFIWDISQEEAFQRVKKIIQNSPVLSHYDPMKKITISADSSSYGLGAVLLQEDEKGERQVVSYASRTLNHSEKNYAQIEKECLALAWAVHKFRDYIVGIEITLETDHKPLVQILQTKPIDDLTPRLLRFRLQLMRYTYKVVYVPGKKLVVADALSRAPLTQIEGGIECNVNVISAGNLEDSKLRSIKIEQEKCQVCCLLKEFTIQGWPHKNKIPKDLHAYYQFRHNLSVQEGFLLYNTRLVIPQTLQKEILNNIHEGHLGITKCRERAKQAVWWLGLSTQIKLIIENCPICIQERHNIKEPLLLEQMPSRAWQKVGIDLFKYDDKWYVVIIDYYSRYIELFQLKDLTENTIIKHCKETFARYGIPDLVRTDNGVQFKSKFKEFASNYNFNHVTSSPYFAQSNGCAEAAVKIAKNLLKKNSDVQLALLIYRNTPGESGYSPSELMFNRKLREILPMFPKNLNVSTGVHKSFVNKNWQYRQKTADNFNKRHKVGRLSELKEGDKVWIIDLRQYGVVKRKAKEPRSYFIEVEGVTYRRNRWHLIPAPFVSSQKSTRYQTPIWEDTVDTNSTSRDISEIVSRNSVSAAVNTNEGIVELNDNNNSAENVSYKDIGTEPTSITHRVSNRIKQTPKWFNDYVIE